MPVGLFMSKINPLSSVLINSSSSVVSSNNSNCTLNSTTTTITPTASILFTENNIENDNKNCNLISNSSTTNPNTLSKENDTHLILLNTSSAVTNNEYSSVNKYVTSNKYNLKSNFNLEPLLLNEQACDTSQHIYVDYNEMNKQNQLLNEINNNNFIIAGNRLNFVLASPISDETNSNYKLINQNRLLLFNQHEKQQLKLEKNDQNNYEKIDKKFRINLINNSSELTETSSVSSSSSLSSTSSLLFSSSNPIMFETTKTEENINYLNKINIIEKNDTENTNTMNKNEDTKINKNKINESNIIDKNAPESFLFQMQQQQQQTSKKTNSANILNETNQNISINNKPPSAQFISIAPYSNEKKQNSKSKNLVQFLSDEQTHFKLIIIDNNNNMNCQINNSDTSNIIKQNTITNSTSNQEFDLENLVIQNEISQIGLETNQQENKFIRNNIDHAIDAVLAKCRFSSSELDYEDDEEQINNSELSSSDDYDNNHLNTTNSSSNNKRQIKRKPKTSSKQLQQQPIVSIENNIPTQSLVINSNTSLDSNQQQQQQPLLMSKSSKARTSYISSLIANRDKKDEDYPAQQQQHQHDSKTNQYELDDKQKRISQNILSILATANGESLSKLETKPDLITKQETGLKPTESHNDSFKIFKTNDFTDLISILEDTKQMKSTQLKSIKTEQSDIDFILNNNDLNVKNKPKIVIEQKPAYLECNNLKRFLSHPIQNLSVDQQLNEKFHCVDDEYLMENNLENILLNQQFDKNFIQIIVKNIADIPQVLQTEQIKIEPIDESKTKNIKRKRSTNSPTTGTPAKTKKRLIKIEIEKPVIKAKKLKTIADIVKHNSAQQQLQQQQITEIKLEEQKQKELADNNDLTLTWLNQSNKTNEVTSSSSTTFESNKSLENFYTSPDYIICNENNQNNQQTQLDMSNIDQIDRLLELEFNNVNVTNNQQSIDKYIDLDDIDVNPLDCYRNNLVNNYNLPNNNHLDEFNFQFSVCSTSSSGYSEPSNFSSSSSSSSSSGCGSFNNNNNNNNNLNGVSNMFSESESSPYYDYHHSPAYKYQQQKVSPQSMQINRNNKNDIAELANKLKSTNEQQQHLQQQQQDTINQCINENNNIFGNFNFFTDEIGAGIN